MTDICAWCLGGPDADHSGCRRIAAGWRVIEPRTQTRTRRTIDHIRQDVANAAKALRVHSETVGRLRAESRTSHTIKLLNAADLKAEADYCAETERLILKLFNSAVRKARKEGT